METLQYTIEKNFKEHLECLNNITSKLISLESRICNLESCFTTMNKNENKEGNIIELKKDMLDIDLENIKKAIIYKDYRSIIYLFKLSIKLKFFSSRYSFENWESSNFLLPLINVEFNLLFVCLEAFTQISEYFLPPSQLKGIITILKGN